MKSCGMKPKGKKAPKGLMVIEKIPTMAHVNKKGPPKKGK